MNPFRWGDEMKKIFQNDEGMVLVTALMFMAILFLLGATGYLITSADLQTSGNLRAEKHAFYDAEAGVQYAIARMEAGLEAGTFSMPSSVGGTVDLPISATPSGYNFTYEGDEVTMSAVNTYQMTVYGGGARNSASKLDVKFKRASAIEFAAFGDVEFDGANSSCVYSYDSEDPDNQPGDSDFESTGFADIGSNGEIILRNNMVVDGDVALGADEADANAVATVDDKGATVSGTLGDPIGWVDPDPLDVLESGYDDLFVAAAATNDNGALPTSLVMEGAAVTLTAGTYYFDKIELKANAGMNSTLTIDASGGPVNIYVQGPVTLGNAQTMDIQNANYEVNIRLSEPSGGLAGPDIFIADNGSIINMSGNPTDFTLYSDSAAGVRFHNSSSLSGVVYAPDGQIEMDNSSDVYGSIWGNEIFIHNSGDLFFDTQLLTDKLTNDLILVSWFNDRND